jgi:hypothetical protein
LSELERSVRAYFKLLNRQSSEQTEEIPEKNFVMVTGRTAEILVQHLPNMCVCKIKRGVFKVRAVRSFIQIRRKSEELKDATLGPKVVKTGRHSVSVGVHISSFLRPMDA